MRLWPESFHKGHISESRHGARCNRNSVLKRGLTSDPDPEVVSIFPSTGIVPVVDIGEAGILSCSALTVLKLPDIEM